MKKRATFISSLLLTTALLSPSAFAQTAPTDTPIEEDEQVEETQPDADVDISAPGGDFSGEIIVRGKFIPNPIRATSEVVSVLGEAEIARAADGDIAGSLQRVTGLSVVGGRFVFVRGLGERYSLALLNGLPLPSPEPLRRVVPLDLFPTSVIASTVVQKSYSANFPGEFGGGVINLTTKSTPDEPFLEIKMSLSGDSETTGKLGYTYDGSDTDIIGYDNGIRDIPSGLAQAIARNIPISVGTEFSSLDLQNFGASLNNANTNLIQENRDIPANFSAEITGGTTFDVGDAFVGIVATAGFENSWRTRAGLQQTSQGIVNINGEPGLLPDQNFNFVTTENRIIVNGLLGLSAEIGEHKLRFTNLYIHDTSKEASIKAGIDAINVDEETLLNQGRTSWFERQLFTSQFVGEFKFDAFSVDLRGAYANSKRDAPYQRSYSYAFDDQIANDFVNDLTSPGESARIQFSDLNDDVYGGGIDLGYETNIGIPVNLNAGYAYYLNDRQAQRRDFRFVPANGLPNPIDQERIDFLLSDFNIFTHEIELREVAAQTSVPAYEAQLEIHAGYGQLDAELADGLRLNVGVRYEDAQQSVTPILLQGGAASLASGISNDYWLPAGTLTWNFADDMQFRLAASKTVARPQFRELAPQQFLDLETDRTFIGNPLLSDSELINVEGRYEYYIGRGERITLAGFYKKIDNPIENVAFVQGGGTLFTGFSNAPTATLYGAEVELVKYFPLNDLGGSFFEDRRLLLAANYTYTKSDIKVGAGDQAINPVTLQATDASNLFDDGDRLTGQSTHVANLQFGMEREDGPLSQQTVLLTYNSPRVTARGPQDQPDLIERTGWRLDFVLREEMNIAGQDFEMKFEARNVLGTGYRESQTLGSSTILNNAYEVGTRFSLSIGLNF
ncbi:TonB-dependent receptor domain-containing protein [Parasphingorhabdus halotolerans]|uniref:TonB-dependent receptor n=1 Tax=Parasphingorhabdus halotolerans TaxID=2725558 RepID=A0A6H2DJ03_9SPHN|nr:TonB-dependent receptor [Parasphingorhabdus halotolerans]QJB68652.1 TonB-dependent receptor [Parasphingorhabdus halotolerans]